MEHDLERDNRASNNSAAPGGSTSEINDGRASSSGNNDQADGFGPGRSGTWPGDGGNGGTDAAAGGTGNGGGTGHESSGGGDTASNGSGGGGETAGDGTGGDGLPDGLAQGVIDAASGNNGGTPGKSLIDDVTGMTGSIGGDVNPIDTIADTGTSIVQQVTGTVGSGGIFTPVLGNLDNLNGTLNGTLDGATGMLNGNGLGGLVSDVADTAGATVNQAAGAISAGGSLGDVLNGVGSSVGTLTDGLLGPVANDLTGNGVVGGILDGLGNNVASGEVGGAGLLDGTPMEGLQGNGALVGANLLSADNSSSDSMASFGVGTDQSQSIVNADALSNRDASGNNIISAEAGPQSSGNGANAGILGGEAGSGGAANAGVGHTDGPSLVDANAGTTANEFQFPALDGTGADGLVGVVGGEIGDITGGGLPTTGALPVSAGLDGHAIIDIGADGAVDAGDHSLTPGTGVMVNTPLHTGVI